MSSTMEIVSIESDMRKKIFLDAHNTRVVGSGSKYMVLGHGYGNDQSVWTHILPHFESNFKVVLYDLACAGSVTKNNGYDFEYYSNITAYVNDLIKILEYLEIDCCVYIGHSISAILGILGAIQRPDLFSKLILLGASARYYNEEGYEGGFDKENIDNVISAMRANYKAWVQTFSQNLIGSKNPTNPDYRDTLLSMGEDISIHISNVVFNIDLRRLLGQVKVPCSILQTRSDITVPMSAAKFLRDHLGGRTNLEILEVKGHLPHLTAPHLVVEKIEQALSTMLLDDFNVRVVGAGQRMLVLGHGMGSDQSVWHHILPFLEPNCRVVLYDLPCAGTVKRRCFDFQRYTTLEDYVDDLFKILHALGIDVCVFVGHSVSAMIGILAARRCPTLFSKLILIGASPRFLNDGDYHGGCEQQDVDKVFSLMKANWGDWVRLQAPLSIGADLPEAVEEFSRTLSNYDPSIMMFAFRTILASDLREILGQVRVPCVIMQTNKDASIPRAVAEFLREHLGVGDNGLVMLDTEGHLPQLTAPALLAQKLQEALAWW